MIFQSVLEQINYPRKIPSLADIHTSLFRPGIYSALFGLFVIVLRHLKKVRGDGFLCWITFDDVEDKKYRIEVFSNPECEEALKYLVDYFYRKGYYDI